MQDVLQVGDAGVGIVGRDLRVDGARVGGEARVLDEQHGARTVVQPARREVDELDLPPRELERWPISSGAVRRGFAAAPSDEGSQRRRSDEGSTPWGGTAVRPCCCVPAQLSVAVGGGRPVGSAAAPRRNHRVRLSAVARWEVGCRRQACGAATRRVRISEVGYGDRRTVLPLPERDDGLARISHDENHRDARGPRRLVRKPLAVPVQRRAPRRQRARRSGAATTNARASGRLLWPMCAINCTPCSRAASPQAANNWARSAVVNEWHSPVVPATNAPFTPQVAR